jgi:hypothetical protein
MNTPRLLFVRPRRKASMVPIYAAILSLVSLALVAFVAAFLPGKYVPSAFRAGQGEATRASQSVETAGLKTPRNDARPPRNRGTWM